MVDDDVWSRKDVECMSSLLIIVVENIFMVSIKKSVLEVRIILVVKNV